MGLVLVAILSLPFLFVLARRPVLRRLAVRNTLRRPREAMFVVLGSLFGTAIIVGSLVVGDTIDSSVRGIAHTRLGPIDEVIVTPEEGVFSDTLASVEETRSALIDGVLGFSRLVVATAAGPEGERLAAPRSNLLELDFDEAREFGDDPSITGIEGPTPEAGHAVLTEDLADKLEVGAGDQVDVFAFGRSRSLTVERVIEAKGIAGFTSGFFNQQSRNVLAPPGTIADLAAGVRSEIGTQFAPPDRIVAVSNAGGVEDGAVHTDEVTRRLEPVVEDLGVAVVPVKQEILDEAEEDAAAFEELFGAMGTFGILAGILLLVNIFVMLGEERKQELGMLRAVGLRRASLVGAFSTEGWVYSLLASAAGTLVGLGLGRVIIAGVERIFSADVEGFGLDLRFAATSESLLTGFGFGFAIAIVAVALTSIRISRFNVISAIRDLPDRRRAREGLKLRWLVAGAGLTALGGAASVSGLSGDAPALGLVGPVLTVLGAGLLIARWVDTRRLVVTATVLTLLWGAVGFPFLVTLGEAGIQVFVVQGVVLTASAVVLVTQEHEVFERIARRLGVGAWAMAARLGLAYPVARRFRTGLTLAMYSLVIFTLTFITALSATFTAQVDETTTEISGGYEVYVRSSPSNPVPVEDLDQLDGVAASAPLANSDVDFTPCAPDATVQECAENEPTDWGVTGFTEEWLEHGPPLLADRAGYASDLDAYRAVLNDPDLILADQFFLQDQGGPPERQVAVGDPILMTNTLTGDRRIVNVAAQSADDFLFNGALYGIDGMRDMFGERAAFNRAYVAVDDGADPENVSAAIAGRFIEQGAEADPIRQLLSDFIAVQNQFFQLFRGYLGFGLLVGIAGLGVVMVRAVRERRREIGVLRSLGFQSRTVRRSFVLEAGFVALEGTLIGVGLALVTAFNVMSNTDAFGESARFIVPYGALSLIVVGTLIASLLATAAPTRAAARIRPAVALRIAD